MNRLDLDQLATLLSFEPVELISLLKDTCGWLQSESPPLKIGHIHSGDLGDLSLDLSRDLLAIAGIPELVRRQRSRIAHSICDTLESFMRNEPIARRAHSCRLLLELCGVCNKVVRVASMEGRQLWKHLEKDFRTGLPPERALGKTPDFLRLLWERAERTGIDWKRLIESGELARYQRADQRYSDIADFRENKEGTGDLLASIQSAAAEFAFLKSVDWSLAYAFLSEFVHPNLGAFLQSEEEHPLVEATHPHLEIGVLLNPSYGQPMANRCTARHSAMVRAAEIQLWKVLRDVFLLSAYLSERMKTEEEVLRSICKALIAVVFDYLDKTEMSRIRSFIPVGRCICLQIVTPEECCFRADQEEK